MDEAPVRLGGMALQNGVLVHGPTSWGCAVRDEDGVLHVASGRKPHLAPMLRKRMPVLRGPIAIAESFALLPTVRRAIPQARFPFERPSVLGAILGTAVAARALRRSRLSAGAREIAAAGVAFLPAALALRGPDLAAYHGAEHISIGTYENGGEPAPKEHPRCGSQLIAPMVASSLAVNVVAAKAPAGTRSLTRLARHGRGDRRLGRGLLVGRAQSVASARARARTARLRDPAPSLDGRAVRRPARGRERRARRLSRARTPGRVAASALPARCR